MTSPTPQPTAVDIYSQAAPWTNATPDRILKTTAVPGSLAYVGFSAWTQNTAAYSAVSPPDPITGQQYFCLVLDGSTPTGMRYDFALNPVPIAGHPGDAAGMFATITNLGEQLTSYTGWTYVIDLATDQHYFVCGAGTTTSNTGAGLYCIGLTQTYHLIPPVMHQYQPESIMVEPQGVWSTGELIWFLNSDGTLWQVGLPDVLANTSTSLQQVGSVGTVQAVISNGSSPPMYYVLSAVENNDGYDLVQFPAGSPSSAVTIESGFSLGAIKTTPDGAVWKVVRDLNPNDLQAPTSEVRLLVPSYPINGRVPAWVDPFANADPSLYPEGLTQSIMDAVPLSATNILLLTTANASSYTPNPYLPQMSWLVTRVAIGVFDQPAVLFNSYSGDALSAYTQISQDLIKADSNANDIRALYDQISSSQASAYFAALLTMTAPSTFSDPAAWDSVQKDLQNEMGDLVSALSFWDATSQVVTLQNQVKTLAVNYVSNSLSIPTTATLINNTAGQVNALNIATLGMGSGSSILTAIGGYIAINAAASAATMGLFSAGAAIVSLLCSFFGSRSTNYSISVSDPMYYISAKLGEIDGVLDQLFTATLNTIESYCEATTKDAGILATVGGLYRNGTWVANPPDFEAGSNQPPESFEAYYNACVLSFFQAFVPLVTAKNYMQVGTGQEWNTYKGKPVYVSPTHTWWGTMGDEYQGALLQYASKDDQSKPLGQDLDALLFTTLSLSYAEVFQQWSIPTTPSWISNE